MDKTILITGSTDGIGQRCAMQLAQTGARVILHGRNPSRGKALLEHIRRKSRNDAVDFVLADFASLRQVRSMAGEVLARYSRIDILVNNAGVYLRERQLSEDGYEMTFAVNHLAHFLLTNLLLDALKKSAPSKIVVVSSMVHQQAHLDFNNLGGEQHYDAYGAYATSKLANLLFTYELAERLKGTSVSVNALHPGVIATKLLQTGFGSFGGSPVEKGAERILHLITSPAIDGISGKYFVNDTDQLSSAESRDRGLQAGLWKRSEQLVGIQV